MAKLAVQLNIPYPLALLRDRLNNVHYEFRMNIISKTSFSSIKLGARNSGTFTFGYVLTSGAMDVAQFGFD